MAGALVLCVAAPITAVVVWFGRSTIEAGKGQPSATAAVNVFILALSSGEELGLRAALAEDRREQLLERWRQLRAELDRTDPPPSKLELGSLTVEDQGADTARVVAQVQGIWWRRGAGSATSINGETHPWRFETRRDDDGWRVWSVEPYAWCGGHVRADACR